MKKILLLFLVASGMEATSQSLSPTVIASAGSFFSNSAGMLSYTVGELASVTTLTSAGNILNQGFHQNFDFGVFIPKVDRNDFQLLVTPNPGNGNFQLNITSEKNSSFSCRVLNTLGETVYKREAGLHSGTSTISIDLTGEAEGIYLLECTLVPTTGDKNPFTSLLKLNRIN